MIGKVLINSAISHLASIGHCGSRNLTAEPDMIQLLVMRVQTCFNIPQAFTVRKLGIGKAKELIITEKPSNPVIALVLFNEFVKLITWQMLQNLCKNGFSCINWDPLPDYWGEGTYRVKYCKLKSKKLKKVHLLSKINILHNGHTTLTGQLW